MLPIKVKLSLLLRLLQYLTLVNFERVEYVKKLYLSYGKEYTHHLVENEACTDALPRYTIKRTYPAKLKCMLSKLLE